MELFLNLTASAVMLALMALITFKDIWTLFRK